MLQFNGNVVAKLIDMGCLAQIGTGALNETLVGTPAYLAPEVLMQQGYDGDKVDIFAAAVTIFLLKFGAYPFG